jgi:hypothetical protein
MSDRDLSRRRLVRAAAAGLAVGSASALAGCGDPGEDGGDEDGGAYRVGDVDPQAGAGAGGSSPG